jgi:hypothetical protein
LPAFGGKVIFAVIQQPRCTGRMEDPMQLPPAIASYFAADRSSDPHLLEGCFEPDAVVIDEGGRHQGPAAIGQWKAASLARYDHHVAPLRSEERDGRIAVAAKVSGNFPNSPAELRFVFALRQGRIATLEIGG